MSDPPSQIPNVPEWSRSLLTPRALGFWGVWIFLQLSWAWHVSLPLPDQVGVMTGVTLAFWGLFQAYARRRARETRVQLGFALLILLTFGGELALVHLFPDRAYAPITLLPLMTLFLVFWVGRRAALLESVLAAIWSGFLWPDPAGAIWYRVLLSLAVIQFLYPLSSRWHFYRLIGAFTGVTLFAILTTSARHSILLHTMPGWLHPLGWTLLEDAVVFGSLFLLLPVYERLFQITTDLTLLDLLTLEHPLIQELGRKAPGTFSHSLAVASLAEAAARQIGANPLLVRVGGLFHDVGKVFRPEYFIENQMGRENPHDHLAPRVSVLILIAHVKDGVRLARQHRLPEPIVRMIQTHHGTTLMRPFFQKAREADPHVSEQPFRYPGPKPVSKEEVIVMLADSVDAACRSIQDPTPRRLKDMMQAVIRGKLEDGQLDESHITLGELSAIQEAFFPVLLGLYHPRIPYPGQEESRAQDRGVQSLRISTRAQIFE